MNTKTDTPRHIVMTSQARMPGNCWGRYGNVAVVRLDPGFEGSPKMISTHARGVAEVTHHYGAHNIGSTERCAFKRTLKKAGEYAAELNHQS